MLKLLNPDFAHIFLDATSLVALTVKYLPAMRSNLIYIDRKQINGCLELKVREELTAKRQEGTFAGDGSILYPDCDACYWLHVHNSVTIVKLHQIICFK